MGSFVNIGHVHRTCISKSRLKPYSERKYYLNQKIENDNMMSNKNACSNSQS